MQYDKEFKLQALELSDEIGVKAAAEQLGIITLILHIPLLHLVAQ